MALKKTKMKHRGTKGKVKIRADGRQETGRKNGMTITCLREHGRVDHDSVHNPLHGKIRPFTSVRYIGRYLV